MVLEGVRVPPQLVGVSPARGLLALTVVALLLASVGFALGLDVGLSLWWVALALGIAVAAGLAGAGLVPTVGSLWLVGLWGFAFPPFVGYLTGSWAGSTRYIDLLLRVNAEESHHGISGRAKRPVGFKTHTFQASSAGFQHRLGCLVARSKRPHP